MKERFFVVVGAVLAFAWLAGVTQFWPAIAPAARPTSTPRPSGEVGVAHLPGRLAVAAGGDIYVIHDGHMSALTEGGGRRDPAFAPDGRRIAYSVRASIDGRSTFENQVVPAHLEYASVVVRTLSAGAEETLVDGLQRRDAGGFHVVEFETQPVWSPDGSKLAFISDGRAGADLQVLTLASKRVATLSAGSLLADPGWSPDGATIAVTTYTNGTPGILLVAAEGGKQARRLEAVRDGQAYRPSYSPDGDWLVVTVRTGRGNDLVAIELATQRVVELTTDGKSWAGVFSPDGERVAFLREHDGQIDLFSLEVGDVLRNGAVLGPAQQVTRDGRLDGTSRPSWGR